MYVPIHYLKLYCPPPCAEFPPPPPVRVSPRYVVLDTSADLVLEAMFRGNYFAPDWVYNEDDPTFRTGQNSLFSSANRTNVGQTYTISAGSASLRVGYYGPLLIPTRVTIVPPTPENAVIVGFFGKYTTVCSVRKSTLYALCKTSGSQCNCIVKLCINMQISL